MKNNVFIVIILFLFVHLGSCRKKQSDGWEDTINTGIIKIACDENFKNFMDPAVNSFEAYNESAIINPIYSNENEVIRLLLDDSVRFALVTRELNQKEQKTAIENKMHVRNFLIAFDGISLITNKINTDSLLSLPTIKKIFTGEITDWSQINPQSRLGTIRVIFESNQSGVLRYVVDSITKGEPLSPQLYAMNSSDELIERVCEFPGAIGVLGFNLIADEVRRDSFDFYEKLRLMRVGREEPATLQNTYLPFAGDIKNEDYPLWRALYVLLSDPRSGLSSGFSIFLAHDIGQMVALKSGLFPAVSDPQNRLRQIINKYPENIKK